MIPDIQKTAQLVQEIAASSSEQSNGANQISKAIEQLSQVTLQNSSSAEEMSTGSEELANQAEMLKDVIGFFNIGKQISVTSHMKKSKSQTGKVNRLAGKGLNLNLNDDNLDMEYEQM